MTLFMVRTWAAKKHAGDRGANLVEYILLVSLIAIAVMAAVMFFGGELGSTYHEVGSGVSNFGP